VTGAVVAVLAGVASTCGGSEAPPTQPAPPATTYRVTIDGNGVVTPTELVVPPGTRVLFTNSHTAPHDMTSDPHPEHDLCPEINQVGLLQPGQTRETGNLVALRTCGFHDNTDINNAAVQGRIVVR
jgi:plastocyanin